ncbi:MAG TPA: hypothetical protein VN377_00730, partial [Candidatus Thermoplasmatota archaeon]|nr:hypothetical protein [Candidatus Thermoplasmatota archaeon]
MKKSQLNVILTAGAVTVLLFSGCVSGIVSTFQSTTTDSSRQKNIVTNNGARITCYVGGILHTRTISYEAGKYLNELFSALVQANANDPCGKGTQMLKVRFIELLANLGLVSPHLSVQDVCSLIEPPWLHSALSLRRS